MKAVTGGAGFIGSRLAERLLESGHEVIIVDNLSSGRRENIPDQADLVEADIRDDLSGVFEKVETVFHFAANPRVDTFPGDREKDFDENLKGTKNVLDACVNSGVDDLVFASSSVVYGENADIPTPKDHRLDPISMYGATKAGAEHICRIYSNILDIELTVVRYANIVGPRNQKGVIWDFIHKLRETPGELEILGNGKQRKSYLYIEDAVEATLKSWKAQGETYNVGSPDSISVDRIAEIVSEEMGLEPEFSYTGGKKGWKGDVPEMRLDISRLESEGWRPEHNSEESVRKTTRKLLEKME